MSNFGKRIHIIVLGKEPVSCVVNNNTLKCGLHLRHWPELSLIKIRGLILSAASTQHPRIQGKPKYCKEVLDAKYQRTILKILLLALLLRGKQGKPPNRPKIGRL